MYAFVYVLFLLNGDSMVDGTVVKSLEECQEIVQKLPAKIAEFNADAENPVKIVSFTASCPKLEKAPQGKKV